MNLCALAPFPYATPLSPFILPYVSFVSVILFACAFISVYASLIVPFHYLVAIIFIQQLVPKNPFLLFLPGFVVSINIHPFQLRLLQRGMMHDPCFIAHGALL